MVDFLLHKQEYIIMKKLSRAVIFATVSVVASSTIGVHAGLAQANFDNQLSRLTDSRDQSTGLPKNVVVYDESRPSTRFVARQAAPQSPASSAAAQRDRAIWRLTDLRDQSTGLPK